MPAGQKYPAAQSLVQGEGCPMTLDHFPGAQSVCSVSQRHRQGRWDGDNTSTTCCRNTSRWMQANTLLYMELTGDVAASKQKRPAGHCPEQMGVVSATVSPNRPALQLVQEAAPPTLKVLGWHDAVSGLREKGGQKYPDSHRYTRATDRSLTQSSEQPQESLTVTAPLLALSMHIRIPRTPKRQRQRQRPSIPAEQLPEQAGVVSPAVAP